MHWIILLTSLPFILVNVNYFLVSSIVIRVFMFNILLIVFYHLLSLNSISQVNSQSASNEQSSLEILCQPICLNSMNSRSSPGLPISSHQDPTSVKNNDKQESTIKDKPLVSSFYFHLKQS